MEQKRIVVKIGSSSLTNAKGEIDDAKVQDHLAAIAQLKQNGHEVILVSSGAVACGFKKLGYPSRPVTLKGKQAAAAVGQGLLVQKYTEVLANYNITPAQVLLTRTDFSKKDRYQNAYETFEELLERGIIPIINENDTVSVQELTFGDNDMLSALVSGLVHADQLIILTDINGLYSDNPKKNPDAIHFKHLTKITDELLGFATSEGSKVGTGGMQSKLQAAKTAYDLGVSVFIGRGEGKNKLIDVLAGHGDGTYIEKEHAIVVPSKKQWISLFSDAAGRIYIDEGAAEALLYKGKSLLPAGVYIVQGAFEAGEVVEVYRERQLIGRGEVLYDAQTLKEAMGKRTDEIDGALDVVIHRDRFVQTERVD
ncbi:gamma-glutamyl kinase [Kurthia sp. 3B1D]|uniref:Glutamate 5-kinase n=2 Tax=Kurthia TaxID=1649 RepID=A0A433RVH1_9BACL|nr:MULTISPECIES: glutamate 5-kinase [unclassified Kurthia]RUS57268.1 gamma-glutamyl kinase [Kurthia sp. 3B1D]HIX42565.1 glutamate 5-kinase [Candidatus Kurthia intestinigallinarum]